MNELLQYRLKVLVSEGAILLASIAMTLMLRRMTRKTSAKVLAAKRWGMADRAAYDKATLHMGGGASSARYTGGHAPSAVPGHNPTAAGKNTYTAMTHAKTSRQGHPAPKTQKSTY
jgi:hypothetical protein